MPAAIHAASAAGVAPGPGGGCDDGAARTVDDDDADGVGESCECEQATTMAALTASTAIRNPVGLVVRGAGQVNGVLVHEVAGRRFAPPA